MNVAQDFVVCVYRLFIAIWCTFNSTVHQTCCIKRSDLTHFFLIARWYSNMFLAYFEDEIGGSIDGSCGAGRTTVHSTSVLVSAKIPRTISFGLNSSIRSRFQHSIVISACHSFISVHRIIICRVGFIDCVLASLVTMETASF